jgi:hypothetical protein
VRLSSGSAATLGNEQRCTNDRLEFVRPHLARQINAMRVSAVAL